MHTTVRHQRISFILYALIISCLGPTVLVAQESRQFAQKGTFEIGGNISYQRQVSVTDGNTGDPLTLFSAMPYIGYFVADGFEIAINPFGFATSSLRGNSTTNLMFFLAPSYNYRTSGIAYPFVEALLGYTSLSTSGTFPTLSGFSWGGRAGAKLSVAERGLLNLGVQYLVLDYSRSGATNRSGSNNLLLSIGLTLWF